ncbi:MAG: hypothetical protein ACTIH2_06535 [Anaerococcus sp.]
MNLQSWIFLILILGFCSYVIYKSWVRQSEGGCSGCPAMKNNGNSCSSCKH